MDLPNNPISCQTFGIGLTVEDDNPAVFILMGEYPDDATHGILFDPEAFANFVSRCIVLAAEIGHITAQLDGLEGDERRAALDEIQERYSAGLN